MLKIIISGCNGHMGRVVETLCANDPAVEVCAGFDILGTSDREFPVYTSPAQFTSGLGRLAGICQNPQNSLDSGHHWLCA